MHKNFKLLHVYVALLRQGDGVKQTHTHTNTHVYIYIYVYTHTHMRRQSLVCNQSEIREKELNVAQQMEF